MFIDFLLDVFRANKTSDFMVWQGKSFSYGWLINQYNYWKDIAALIRTDTKAVAIVEADFSPNSVALFLALIENGCIIVPRTKLVEPKRYDVNDIAQGNFLFNINEQDGVGISHIPNWADHKIYQKLRDVGHPGLVLFTSGTSGEPKAAVHDFLALLEKFKVKRKPLRTLNFLLFDHWGGLNTMFHILSNGGTVITTRDRSPNAICNLIEKYHIELLPTSPTFLNILLISEAYKRYNLSSLKIISYGTEPMLESTLVRMNELFPAVKFQQTYGSIEIGVLRSRSEGNNSLWVKIGGEGFQTRIVDGILQIKAASAMLGYLNAPSPFTDDGWFNTGDTVEVKGEYIKILGRKSEIINVGGEKVHPAEVESIIQKMENVSEVTVYGEKNPIVGNIVCAKVSLLQHEDRKKFILQLKKFCHQRLKKYKVPIKVFIVNEKQYSERHKKIRRND